jgi:hypothetical protein
MLEVVVCTPIVLILCDHSTRYLNSLTCSISAPLTVNTVFGLFAHFRLGFVESQCIESPSCMCVCVCVPVMPKASPPLRASRGQAKVGSWIGVSGIHQIALSKL